MADLRGHRFLLVVICLTKSLGSTKLWSELKKCGDLECETLISRVLATRDYRGPDCRYLNFTKGEEISVYVKLAGGREDLWAGSKGKDFGYFPKDAVQVEEVFISEEVQVSTKESDFLCLFGLSYIFENEDSELNSDYDETIFPYEEDEDNFQEHESDFQIKSEFYSTSESTLLEDQVLATGPLDDIGSTSESTFWEEIEAETVEHDPITEEEQDQIPEVDLVPPSASVPDVRGWFGARREQAEGKAIEPMIAPLQDNSFRSRKIAVVDEKYLEELNNDEPQIEYKQEPNTESDSLPKKWSDLASESEEHILKPQATGWFGGRFTSYLGFGDDDTELELLSKESNPPLQDVPNPLSSDEEPTVPCTETLVEKEDSTTSNSSSLNSNWFDFGFGMLGFAYASEDKTMPDDRNNEGGRSDKHEHHPVSKFGSDKEEETELIKVMETEDQTDKKRVLRDTDDSDTLPYFKKFLYNFDNPWKFQNIPKETELSYPKLILDEDNIIENDETEDFSAENYPTDMHFMRLHEEVHSKTPAPKNNDEKSEISLVTEGHTQVEINGFVENTLSSPDNPMSSQNYIPHKEDVFEFQKYLFQIDVYDFMNSAISPIVILKERVVAALPDDMKPSPNSDGFPWELLICASIFGFFAVILFVWRSFQSVRSRLYIGREKKLAIELSALIEEKCKLLEKFSLLQKEYDSLESSVKDANFGMESTEAQNLEFIEGSQIPEAAYDKLDRSKSDIEDEIVFLEKELEEEKLKHSKQDELMTDSSERIQSLEDESKSLKSQVAEAKMTFKIFQMNEERLKIAIKDALNENSQLQENQKKLVQDADLWQEQLNELNKQKIAFEDSKIHAEQVLNDKENQIKSLTERLLTMKDWAAVLGDDVMHGDNLELETKTESENGAHLDDQPRGALKKLIHAAKLNASLKTLEGERNQIYTQLSEVDKTKEELTGYNRLFYGIIKRNKLIFVLRKLTVEENHRLEKQEKLSKADEKLSYAAEELETYRKRAKDLEEELERTVLSYQGQIISHEKKAHDNWLAARTAERNLNDLRKENANNRQKLTEAEFKYELLEKDLYALDVTNTTFGREHSPYGPSPLGRPSSETRAFLSPPTLLEGPLRLSPLLPGGGGRGSRGPGGLLEQQITNERGDTNYDRLLDPHRAPSDTGSLSPPWEQDRRMMIPPSGQPYPDPALPPQRQDRFYSNSGRLSGPAELRGFNMPSLDKADGPVSSEMESSKNDPKDDLSVSIESSVLPMYLRNVYSPRGFPPYLPRPGFYPRSPHPESRSEFPSGPIPPSNEPTTEHPDPPQET
ncbi:melanoma inhibitory activity protein 2 [Echinops telfairi]|uniref:Melanoma inhibitory activity protein 2 n=1 Tax=Echinops telfairi TaxID=9371 RepID=A0AC55CVR2_ECHTE|nr:melanoma inhibitory activity protein 2 [Echinops telfairi]